MKYVWEHFGGLISLLDDIGALLKTPPGIFYSVGVVQLLSVLAFWHLYETWQIFMMGILGGFILGCGTFLLIVRKMKS